MLAQTLNAILARFQNRRPGAGPRPAGPLRPRPAAAAEQPVLGLGRGRVPPADRAPPGRPSTTTSTGSPCSAGRSRRHASVDSRSRLRPVVPHAAHTCATCSSRRTTTPPSSPTAFPLLNALRETHLILAEGAHNQFGDLPSAARAEMLIMQWLLARPEMREFLGGRVMVPYEEAWMDRVDTMKQIQGWTRHQRHALPRPGRLRRAAAAVDPVRQLERRQRPAAGRELGPLLARRRSSATSTPTGRRPASTSSSRADATRPGQLLAGGSGRGAGPPAESGGGGTSPRRCTSACATPRGAARAGRRSPPGGRARSDAPPAAAEVAARLAALLGSRARRCWPARPCTRCATASTCSPGRARRWPSTRRSTR